MKEIGGFFARLSSRKFLITVGSVLILFATDQYTEAVAIIVAFIGAEGAADAVSRYSVEKTKQDTLQRAEELSELGLGTDVDIDKSHIVSGGATHEFPM